jgi:hypothetical protein
MGRSPLAIRRNRERLNCAPHRIAFEVVASADDLSNVNLLRVNGFGFHPVSHDNDRQLVLH